MKRQDGWLDRHVNGENSDTQKSISVCQGMCKLEMQKKLLFHAVTEILHSTTQHTRSLTALIHKTMCVAI